MQENLPLVHLSMPTFFLQMSSVMAGVFSARRKFGMDDEDVSLICVMT